MLRRFLVLFFLALALQAQETAPPGINAGITNPPTSGSSTAHPLCDATDWKARTEWLEGVVAQLQAEVSGALQLYNAQQQLTGLAAKEPPKPKPEAK